MDGTGSDDSFPSKNMVPFQGSDIPSFSGLVLGGARRGFGRVTMLPILRPAVQHGEDRAQWMPTGHGTLRAALQFFATWNSML